MGENYKIRVHCSNCNGYTGKAEIPKGKTVGVYLKENICPKCGCKNVLRKDFAW